MAVDVHEASDSEQDFTATRGSCITKVHEKAPHRMGSAARYTHADREWVQGWPQPQSNSRRSVDSRPILTFDPSSSFGLESSKPASNAATIRAPLDISWPAQFSITCFTQKLLNCGGLATVALLSHWRHRSICLRGIAGCSSSDESGAMIPLAIIFNDLWSLVMTVWCTGLVA